MILETHWGLHPQQGKSKIQIESSFLDDEQHEMVREAARDFARSRLMPVIIDDLESKLNGDFFNRVGFTASDYKERAKFKFNSSVLLSDEVTKLIVCGYEYDLFLPVGNLGKSETALEALAAAQELNDLLDSQDYFLAIVQNLHRPNLSSRARHLLHSLASQLALEILTVEDKIKLIKWDYKRVTRTKTIRVSHTNKLWQVLPALKNTRSYLDQKVSRKKVVGNSNLYLITSTPKHGIVTFLNYEIQSKSYRCCRAA
ncbi:hypothetical protein [Lewinella sp. W8]|uniref:hypothetical protein n=1 Tax=Lewinella sp. W8 TaxID=2528208 RepID=UPI0010684AF8|nr:hypothetical protein [Lewinella sp. W8]MTB53920.1 hypothetical protein [Lewinella sp. W8]